MSNVGPGRECKSFAGSVRCGNASSSRFWRPYTCQSWRHCLRVSRFTRRAPCPVPRPDVLAARPSCPSGVSQGPPAQPGAQADSHRQAGVCRLALRWVLQEPNANASKSRPRVLAPSSQSRRSSHRAVSATSKHQASAQPGRKLLERRPARFWSLRAEPKTSQAKIVAGCPSFGGQRSHAECRCSQTQHIGHVSAHRSL
jgi:hypothetical protein